MSRQRPVALVTGGRRGIGLGIARALAAKGFDLAITDRERDEAVIHELRGLGEGWLSLKAIWHLSKRTKRRLQPL